MRRLFPNLEQKLTRTLTMPRTMSLVSGRANAPPGAKVVPYISFDAIVGRNSSFHHLTSEQRDKIGGVEYRALRALLWIIGAVSRMTSAASEGDINFFQSITSLHKLYVLLSLRLTCHSRVGLRTLFHLNSAELSTMSGMNRL